MNSRQQELSSRLDTVDQCIRQSERNVTLQRVRVEAIRRTNGDVSLSFALLEAFEESLVLRYLIRERLQREFEAAKYAKE